MSNKKSKKWHEIVANEKVDFEMSYNQAVRLIAHLQNCLLQLSASYKNLVDK